ncbi:type VII secretion system-associated protein [Saccharopolyspora oryzae]|uniref:Type VII secretion system-associated protein n=1 Tax=Saccharopolyspora oryzae TaxID=2997343 RepID=A0ABT4V1T5_9PSEU|nr:type VII secretion system-associated protein [Saccharopolyspora oryzae]MDA3627910.1 type VII secretion system-associated protein [Saccharopolyspora oryzae]
MSAEEALPAESRWVFLIDPAWHQQGRNLPRPPREAVVGGWYVEADGTTGRFRSNPDYAPGPDSPTDPVDAVLRLAVKGRLRAGELLAVLRDAEFGIAVDDEGAPVVAPAPDGEASILVTTAPAHRDRVRVAGWRDATAAELAEALPDEGVDVLLNPGSTASTRILASALREAVG